MKNFFKLIIYSLIISIIIYIFIQFISKKDIVQVFGYSSLKVITGSMSPEIEAGEKIIIKKCKDYDINDIITFKDSKGYIITHRIISKEEDYFITKGDYNNIEDEEKVYLNQIYGKVIYHFNSKIFNGFSTTFSKYNKSNSKVFFAKIAEPIFIVNGNSEINIDKYNTVNNYTFSIKNFINDDISDVSLKYKINIIADEKVEYELLLNNFLKINENTEFTLNKAVKTERKYTLKIYSPEDYSGNVKINVLAYQDKL